MKNTVIYTLNTIIIIKLLGLEATRFRFQLDLTAVFLATKVNLFPEITYLEITTIGFVQVPFY